MCLDLSQNTRDHSLLKILKTNHFLNQTQLLLIAELGQNQGVLKNQYKITNAKFVVWQHNYSYLHIHI